MYDETKDDNDIALAGSLLLAHPHLRDPNFAHSVVLMTTHEEEGSLGVILNKSAGQKLGDLNEEFVSAGLGEVPVYLGGPVNPEQIIIAAWKTMAGEGHFQLFFGLEPLVARSKMETDPELIVRAFRGYAGWSAGQLLGELEGNAWVVSDVDGDMITEFEGRALWQQLIMAINPELGLISLEPEEPENN